MISEAVFLVKLLLQWNWSWSWSCRSHILQLFHHSVSWWVASWVASLMKLMEFYPFSIASCEALFEAPQEAMSKGPFILPIDLVCMCSYKVVQVSIFSTKHKQDPIGRHHMCVMCVGIWFIYDPFKRILKQHVAGWYYHILLIQTSGH